MKRRWKYPLIGLGILGTFYAALYHYGQENACVVPFDPEKLEQLRGKPSLSAEKFYPIAYGFRPYTLKGDTDHSDFRFRKFTFGPDNRQTVAESPIRHVFVEQNTIYQDDLDKALSKQIPYNQYVKNTYLTKWLSPSAEAKTRRLIFNSFLAWHSSGIDIHKADLKHKLTPEVLEYRRDKDRRIKLVRKLKSQACGPFAPITINNWIAYYIANPLDFFTVLLSKRVYDPRRNDYDRTKLMQSKASNSPSLIIFGAGHFSKRVLSIKSLLGPQNTLHIDSYGDELNASYNLEILETTPDFVHVIAEGKVYQMGDVTFKQLYAAHQKRSQTGQEFIQKRSSNHKPK